MIKLGEDEKAALSLALEELFSGRRCESAGLLIFLLSPL